MERRLGPAPAARPEADGGHSACIVAVGDTESWRRMKGPAHAGAVTFVGFHEVDADLMRQAGPGLVVSPLVSRRFDCVDLAKRLHDLGFRGRYRVLDDDAPSPDLIMREVRSFTPGLDFGIERLEALLAEDDPVL